MDTYETGEDDPIDIRGEHFAELAVLTDYVLPTVKVFNSVVCLVGLCGNTLVIYVVLRFSEMRRIVTNIYILNLALANLCCLSGLPLLVTTMHLQYWPFGSTLCKLYMTGISVNQVTSSIFLTVLAVDRYISLFHPKLNKYRTPLAAILVSLAVWIVSILIVRPIFVYSLTVTVPELGGIEHCNIIWPEWELMNMNSQTAFTMYSFVLGFGVPIMIIASEFYVLIIFKLRRVVSKYTRLVLTLIAVYVVCWSPYWTTQIILILTKPTMTNPMTIIILHLITGCVAFANSAVNPILYVFLSEKFRKNFVRTCTCRTQENTSGRITDLSDDEEEVEIELSTVINSPLYYRDVTAGGVTTSTPV